MSYNTAFRVEFYEEPPIELGYTPALVRVLFKLPDYSGDIVDLSVDYEEPVTTETIDSNDNRFDALLPNKAEFNLIAQSYWQVQSLYAKEDQSVQVLIEMDITGTGDAYSTVFTGWLESNDTKEDYYPMPYPVKLNASDGLSLLKTRLVLDKNGKRLHGTVSLVELLRTILYNTGLDLPLQTAVNVYEQGTLADAGNRIGDKVNPALDPLFEAMIDTNSLVLDQGDLYAWDALKKVLEPFGARIAQVGGAWRVYRADECAGGWDVWNTGGDKNDTLHYHTYSSSDFSAGPSAHARKSLLRTVYIDQPVRVLTESKPITFLAPRKDGIKVEFDFGRTKSTIPGAELTDLDSTFLPVGWVRQNIANDKAFVTGAGTELDPPRLALIGSTNSHQMSGGQPHVYVDVDIDPNGPEYKKTLARTLKAEFRTQAISALLVFVYGYRFDGKYVLQSGGDWVRNAAPDQMVAVKTDNYLVIDNKKVSKPGWQSLSIPMNAVDRMYKIRICFLVGLEADPSSLTSFVELKNITLQVEQEGLNLQGYAVTIVPKNRKPDTVASLTLGDIPDVASPYTKLNTLLGRGGLATRRWYKGNALVGTDDTTGKNLVTILAEAYAKQDMAPAHTFEGDLVGRLPEGIHQILVLPDFGEVDESTPLFQVGPRSLTFSGNEIRVGASLPWLVVGEQILISGTTSNNGTYTITATNTNGSTWAFQVSQSLISETAAGGIITEIRRATPYRLQQTRQRYKIRSVVYSTTAVNTQTKAFAVDYPKTPLWKDKDGNEFPVNLDNSNVPVYPSSQETLSPRTKEILEAIKNGSVGPITGKVRPTIPGAVPNTGQSISGRLVVRNTANNTILATLLSRLRLLPSILRLP